MSEAIRAVLPLAVAIAVFPVPIVAAVLLVGSERGRLKGLAFLLAWAAGLAVIGALVLLAGGIADAGDDGSRGWTDWLLLALGLVVLAAAAAQWRGRPRAGEEPPVPAWMRRLDGLTVARAARAGIALSALNPKNALLAAAAAAEIAAAELPAGEEAAALAAFVLVASLGVLAPLALAAAVGERSQPLLDGIRSWMARHTAVVMTVLLALIGLKLVADGVTGIAG